MKYKASNNLVLTPDGGIIECRNEAAANRVADDFNTLCEYISKPDTFLSMENWVDQLLDEWEKSE